MSVRVSFDRASQCGGTLEFCRHLDEPTQCLRIGLVNTMQESAFEATERQFISLLERASAGFSVCLSLYTLPGMGKTAAGRGYRSTETLLDEQMDGLIVTGREPLAADLRDEPYWPSFTEVLGWARRNTHSAVWSCLAAHAAILHMDNIGRIRSHNKHSGVLECARVANHPLSAGLSARFGIPHSRWNGVAEQALVESGYSILSRTGDAGVDAFSREEQKSLFLFFQGHPEYESDTLMREYRRDVGRFLRGEASTHPGIPGGYFDTATEAALDALRKEAEGAQRSCRGGELLASVLGVLQQKSPEDTWHQTAAHIYRNWLTCISARKSGSLRDASIFVDSPGISLSGNVE